MEYTKTDELPTVSSLPPESSAISGGPEGGSNTDPIQGEIAFLQQKSHEGKSAEDALLGRARTNLDIFDLQEKELEPLKIKPMTKWENSKEYKSAQLGKTALGMGFALFIASIVGSMAMRTGSKGALAALTAAMQGWKEGDKAKWDRARNDYDKNVENIQRENEILMRKYNETRNNDRMSFHEKQASLVLLAKAYGMPAEKSEGEIEKLFQAQINAAAKIKVASTKAVEEKKKAASKKGPTAASLEEAAYQEWHKTNPEGTRAQFHTQVYNKSKKGGGFNFIKPAGSVAVTDPKGKIHTFPDQKSADEYKAAIGKVTSKAETGTMLAQVSAQDVPLGTGTADKAKQIIQLQKQANDALQKEDYDKYDKVNREIQELVSQQKNIG